MLSSMHAFWLAALVLGGCAQTSQSPPSTTAPVTSASSAGSAPMLDAPVTSVSASPPVAPSVAPDASGGGAVDGGPVSAGGDDRFRACQADSECVAVPRAGCCHNGWKEAVATTHADDYAQANACLRSPRPMCPMYMVRDFRVARCDSAGHLCTMVKPGP